MNYSWSSIVWDYSFLKRQSTKFKLICQYRKEKTTLVKVYISPEAFRRLRLPGFPENLHMKVARLSAPRSGCLYSHRRYLSRPQGLIIAGRIKYTKNLKDGVENQTLYLSAFSAVHDQCCRNFN